jgi:hypothetical protein
MTEIADGPTERRKATQAFIDSLFGDQTVGAGTLQCHLLADIALSLRELNERNDRVDAAMAPSLALAQQAIDQGAAMIRGDRPQPPDTSVKA